MANELDLLNLEIKELESGRDELSIKEQLLNRKKRRIIFGMCLEKSKDFVGKSFGHKDEKSFITVLRPVDFDCFFDLKILRVLEIYIDRFDYSIPISFSYENYSISQVEEDFDELDRKGKTHMKDVVFEHLKKVTGWPNEDWVQNKKI